MNAVDELEAKLLQCPDDLDINGICPFCQNGIGRITYPFHGEGERIRDYIVYVWFCGQCGGIVGISKCKEGRC